LKKLGVLIFFVGVKERRYEWGSQGTEKIRKSERKTVAEGAGFNRSKR